MKPRQKFVIASLVLVGVGALVVAQFDTSNESSDTPAAEPDETTHRAPETMKRENHAPRLSRRVAQALGDGDGVRAGRIIGSFKSATGCDVQGDISKRQVDPGPVYGKVRGFLDGTNDVGVAMSAKNVVIIAVTC